MQVSDWLELAEKLLTAVSIATARLDALVLLEDETGKERGWLLAHPEYKIQGSQLEKLSKKCIQRATHTPLAYVRGKTEFYGREFYINKNVLEPRPESEAMIELLVGLPLPAAPVIADIGTGSGALGVTATLELPQATVFAVDIDRACLQVARRNATAHGTRITFLESNFLSALADTKLDVLLCNLPYVPDDFHINTAATHEPALAIFGGPDGLDHYRTLFAQIDARKQQPSFILTESLPPQHAALAQLASEHGYALTGSSDFIQVFDKR